MSTAVRMVNITKTFSGLKANDKINFEVKKGEVHGLLGENGAGKTVLMKILYGMHKPDQGQIFVDDQEVRIDNSAKAISLGIGMVHQHFMLVPSLTVAENIVLGLEPTKYSYLLNIDKTLKDIKSLSDRYRLQVDPKAIVSTIPVGIQQRVEILKALYRRAEILILDEPTSILTPQEVESLFEAIRELKRQGKSVIFITHKLKEVCAICDRITVLKKGKVVGTVDRTQTNSDALAQMMVGREVLYTFERKQVTPGKIVLKTESLNASNDRKLPALRDVNLEIHESEILGLAGIEGNGQTELVEVLTGLRESRSGKISFLGETITKTSTHRRIEKGFANVPEDRQKTGLILDFSVLENLILGRQDKPPFATKWSILDLSNCSKFAGQSIEEYSIKTPSEHTLARYLSGGTQQRVVIAREFSRKPKFIIASQPTRGLDIGATEYVHTKLVEMRDQGCAILLITADLDEMFALSDRIAVIYEGRIVALKERSETNELELGLFMTGGKCG
jgi:simple sugar transport system ATP-binding protein